MTAFFTSRYRANSSLVIFQVIGRKIIIDTDDGWGGYRRRAFPGKDPTNGGQVCRVHLTTDGQMRGE